jgi:hypothetical protein
MEVADVGLGCTLCSLSHNVQWMRGVFASATTKWVWLKNRQKNKITRPEWIKILKFE